MADIYLSCNEKKKLSSSFWDTLSCPVFQNSKFNAMEYHLHWSVIIERKPTEKAHNDRENILFVWPPKSLASRDHCV